MVREQVMVQCNSVRPHANGQLQYEANDQLELETIYLLAMSSDGVMDMEDD